MTTGAEKQRRMALRRAVGNRDHPPLPTAPAPRPAYPVAHACFRCRSSHKVRRPADAAPRCPRCSADLHEMGRTFKAPRRGDVEQWEKVQTLYAHGFRFFSDDSYPDAARLPARLREVEGFIGRHPAHPLRVCEARPELLPRVAGRCRGVR